MTAMDEAPEPIPDHVTDAVLKAMETGDFPTYFDPLSPEDKEHAHRYITSLQAYKIMYPDAGSDAEDEPRDLDEIQAAEQEMFERLWYYRTLAHPGRKAGELAEVEDKLREFEAKYDNLVTEDQFELGMLHGKLSALRWVLGDDWDMLDT